MSMPRPSHPGRTTPVTGLGPAWTDAPAAAIAHTLRGRVDLVRPGAGSEYKPDLKRTVPVDDVYATAVAAHIEPMRTQNQDQDVADEQVNVTDYLVQLPRDQVVHDGTVLIVTGSSGDTPPGLRLTVIDRPTATERFTQVLHCQRT